MTRRSRLPTLGDERAVPKAQPKTSSKSWLRASREAANAEAACRRAVWLRDGGRSRASDVPLEKHGPDDRRGEVAHLEKRSTTPARKWDPNNCILLSAEEHRVSDARTAPGGQVLLEIIGTDARQPLSIIRRDVTGATLWTRLSLPSPIKRR